MTDDVLGRDFSEAELQYYLKESEGFTDRRRLKGKGPPAGAYVGVAPADGVVLPIGAPGVVDPGSGDVPRDLLGGDARSGVPRELLGTGERSDVPRELLDMGGDGGDDMEWISWEALPDQAAGSVVKLAPTAMEMGDRAINEMPDGRLYFCVKVPRSDIKKWCEKLLRLWDRLPADDGQKATGGLAALMEDMDRVQHGADDVRTVMDQVVATKYQRTLEVAHDARGAPYRALPDVMATLTEIVKPAHWPLRGPVTILWVIQFCLEHGGSCTGRHTKWVAEGGLTPADAGVTLHLAAAKVMQLAVQYDQLNVGHLASLELVARQFQLCEEKHKHKFTTTGGEAGDAFDDQHLFFGTSQTRYEICVCPELSEWIAEELHKEAATNKERRKAREERALALKIPGAKPVPKGK